MLAGVKLVNNTEENLRIALFKLPYKAPSLRLLTWKIIALPTGGGNKVIKIPTKYEVYINYSNDPVELSDPYGGVHTSKMNLDQTTAKFILRSEFTNDGRDCVASLKRVFYNLTNNEIHIENRSSFGVWGHILLDGDDIYPPQIITPGRTLMENVESSLYVSIIDEQSIVGSIIKVRELRSKAVAINPGDTVSFTGNKWEGYIIKEQ